MKNTSQKIRLLLFLSGGVALAGVFVFLIAGNELFRTRHPYFVEFSGISVGGLQPGSAVRYNGINVGTVEDVRFAPGSVQNVVIRISVDSSVPVKADAKARLQAVGITGVQQIEIFGATDDAEDLPPGSPIAAEMSQFDQLTEPAVSIVNELQRLVFDARNFLSEENQVSIERGLADLAVILSEGRQVADGAASNVEQTWRRIDGAASGVDGMIIDNRDAVATGIDGFSRAALQLAETAARIERFSAALLAGDDVTSLAAVLARLDSTIAGVNDTVSGVNDTVAQLGNSIATIERIVLEGEDTFLDSLVLLEDTLQYLNNFALTISENPSRIIRQ
ncbi:MAG: MCE family protein [Spirochaetaceae bacterium]|nr:MAG: MCE family protein [Spirochaetaceae bacterium]